MGYTVPDETIDEMNDYWHTLVLNRRPLSRLLLFDRIRLLPCFDRETKPPKVLLSSRLLFG